MGKTTSEMNFPYPKPLKMIPHMHSFLINWSYSPVASVWPRWGLGGPRFIIWAKWHQKWIPHTQNPPKWYPTCIYWQIWLNLNILASKFGLHHELKVIKKCQNGQYNTYSVIFCPFKVHLNLISDRNMPKTSLFFNSFLRRPPGGRGQIFLWFYYVLLIIFQTPPQPPFYSNGGLSYEAYKVPL